MPGHELPESIAFGLVQIENTWRRQVNYHTKLFDFVFDGLKDLIEKGEITS